MALFKKAENTQAYLKAGFLGFAGDGKTYTATNLAIGLVELMRQRGLEAGDKPVFFLDSETGSDWVAPRFKAADIELQTAKTRAFTDLLAAMREAEKGASVMIIDSISHFWRELCDAYARRRNRTRLQFQDWAYLKAEWQKFTDLYINGKCHCVMCGRAGYEYDYFEDDDGKKELHKTGIKMRAETETGYEPSILVLMAKHRDMESGETWRTAQVLKDRAARIDGLVFKNPTFKDFTPHIDYLNLGGEHLGIDTTRNSDAIISTEGTEYQVIKLQKEIALEEILELLKKHFPSQSADDKSGRQAILEQYAGTLSWKKVETFDLEMVKALRDQLWMALEKHPHNSNETAQPKLEVN